MRKYFLLSTVAIFSSVISTATVAETYRQLDITASVIPATVEECTPLNFGKITIKKDYTEASTVTIDHEGHISFTGGVLDVDNSSAGSCYYEVDYFPENVTLYGEGDTTQKLTVSNLSCDSGSYYIAGTLTIPSGITEDTFSGSITVSTAY